MFSSVWFGKWTYFYPLCVSTSCILIPRVVKIGQPALQMHLCGFVGHSSSHFLTGDETRDSFCLTFRGQLNTFWQQKIHNFEAQLRSSAPTKCVLQGLCQSLARFTSQCARRLLELGPAKRTALTSFRITWRTVLLCWVPRGHIGAGFVCPQPSFSCSRCAIIPGQKHKLMGLMQRALKSVVKN